MNEYDPAYPGMLNCAHLRYTDVDTLSAEQKLFDNYWQELINMYGVGLAWQVHRYDKTTADNLYGEHANQPYADPVEILGLVDLQENAVALSKYGFVTDDTIKLYLHIRSYTETFEPLGIYQAVNQKYIAPKAGDIFTLYEFGKTRPLGLGGKMFEVTDRTDQDVGMNINQLAGHYVWVINAKRYDPSYEPNVEEEKESYQIFDDEYTGRIVDNKEVRDLPSEQKAYEYSVQDETNEKVFDYNDYQMSTEMYGGYLKAYAENDIDELLWYATTEEPGVYTIQKTTDLIDGQYYHCFLVPEYNSTQKQGIKIPSFYTLYKIELFNKLTGQWNILGGNEEQGLKLFNTKKSPVFFNGEWYDYTQYEYNGPLVGEREMKFYVKPFTGSVNVDVNVNMMNWYATIKGDGTFSEMETPSFTKDGINYYEVTLASERNGVKQAIQIPSNCTVNKIEIFNTLTQQWEVIGGNDEYSVSMYPLEDVILQIAGEYYKYKQYTYNGPIVGARATRFYVDVVNTEDTNDDQQPVTPPPADLPWWATSENINRFTEQSLDQFVNNEYFECVLQPETNKQKQAIQIPAGYELQYIKLFNENSNRWIFINDKDYSKTLFEATSITKTINGQKYPYTTLTHIGDKTGERILRFYVTA